MKITPILTEKSLNASKEGRYSFWVPMTLNKNQIKELVNSTFGVHVTVVRTINLRKLMRKNIKGDKVTTSARKKAIVRLSKSEKIDLFETKKGK